MQFGVLVEVLFCELDGRVLGGMQFGVLAEVRDLTASACSLASARGDVVRGAWRCCLQD